MPPAAVCSPVRLLCTGDLHLGRQPSRIPPGSEHLSIGAVWQRTVDYAVEQRVDALVLTGDLADSSNRYFESYGPLRRGLQRLLEARIPVYAVAGNHDYDVLPRLANTFGEDEFYLLGREGKWESKVLKRDGAPVLQIAGRSFSSRHEPASPLDGFVPPESDVPIVVLLHGDLDAAPGSLYAPFYRSDIERHKVAAWLLGHIHRPAVYTLSNGIALYPGSLQPLDPGEEEMHGPWVVEIMPDGRSSAQQVPLASICYVTLEIDITGVDNYEKLEERLSTELENHLKQNFTGNDDLRMVVYRLRLLGRTLLHRQIDVHLDHIIQDLRVPFGQVDSLVDTVEVLTRPAIDLEQVATRKDPPGVLARLLLELEEDHQNDAPVRSTHQALFETLNAEIEALRRASAYSLLADRKNDPDITSPAYLRNLAIHQARLLLDEMLDQLFEVAHEITDVPA